MPRSLVLLVAPLLIGCATTHPILSMQIDVMPKDGDRMAKLPMNGTLHQGARYAISAQVGAPAYVYAVQVEGPGTARLISGKEAQKAMPGVAIHIPEGSTWLTQSPTPGSEVLVLVAAPGPLGEARVLSEAKRSSSPAAGKKRDDPPPLVNDKNRGDSIEVVQDPKGVTVARFPFTRAGEGP